MPDSRFYEDLGPVGLDELIQLTGATRSAAGGDPAPISAVAPLERAEAGQVSYFADRRYRDAMAATRASACFITPSQADAAPSTCVALITNEPEVAYVTAAERLHRPRPATSGQDRIDPTAVLEEDVRIAPGAVIGPNARVGRGTVIGANTVIGAGVAIGRDCVVGPNVTIGFALIGDRVRIFAGVVIGEAGFKIAGSRRGAIDVPQLGRVILQDGVTVGANSCIDRGAWEDTVVGENTKIDNQVQIGHNVRLGRSCVLCGQVGLSGSTIVGDGVMFGAKAGIADHVTIGDGAQVMAASGVMHDIPAGEIWGGAPAVRARQFWRQVTWISRMGGPATPRTDR